MGLAVRILFILRHAGFVRNFESALRLLCERGHQLHVGFLRERRHWLLDRIDLAQQLQREYASFSTGMAPVRDDAWTALGQQLRGTMDYVRYFDSRYQNAPKLRARAAHGVPDHVQRLARAGALTSHAARAVLTGWHRLLERSLPVDDDIATFVAGHRPDLLVVSPLIEPGSPQREYVRAARALGIRTILCVGSWDNLTNKGLIHGAVDRVTVWNEFMKREAVELHGIEPSRVVVTGAQLFDHWFDWRPSTSREEFCARAGLDSRQPYLLYVCSSRFVAPEETGYVRGWVKSLRQSSYAPLRSAGVLVRPHPQNDEQWQRFDSRDLPQFAVYPRGGAVPIDAESKRDYYDSIYHSAAVVGINTTAEIESAIVGRPVYTVLAPEFRDTQEGTLHFDHLRTAGGGLVHVARDAAEHLAQLDAALRGNGADDARCRRFVEAFIRPRGIERPATPQLVEAIESTVAISSVGNDSAPLISPVMRVLMRRRAARVQREASERVASKVAQRTASRQLARDRRKRQLKESKRRRAGA